MLSERNAFGGIDLCASDGRWFFGGRLLPDYEH
jgi:hypothetical protein